MEFDSKKVGLPLWFGSESRFNRYKKEGVEHLGELAVKTIRWDKVASARYDLDHFMRMPDLTSDLLRNGVIVPRVYAVKALRGEDVRIIMNWFQNITIRPSYSECFSTKEYWETLIGRLRLIFKTEILSTELRGRNLYFNKFTNDPVFLDIMPLGRWSERAHDYYEYLSRLSFYLECKAKIPWYKNEIKDLVESVVAEKMVNR